MFHHPIPTQKPQVSWQSWTLELWPIHHFHLIWLQKPSGSNPNTVSEGTANPPSHVTIPQSHFLSEGRAGSIGFINLFIFGYNPTSHYNPIMIPLGCWNSHIFLGHIPLSHQKIPLGSWETNSGQENLQGSRKKERNIPWRRKFRPAQSRPTSASSTSTLKLSQNRDPKNCQTWQVGSHTSPKMLGKCGKNGSYVALSPINRCL